jgi:ribosomal protein S27E
VEGTCDGCGNVAPVGALHAWRSAGLVLRCPACGAVLVRIVEAGERTWVSAGGLRALAL